MAVILIVEDDFTVLFVAEYALSAEGHEIVTAASRKEAIELLGTRQDVDVLVTDINLRGDARAGVDLADTAVRLKPKLGVVYATGTEIDSPLVAQSEFLAKPYSTQQLTQAVDKVLKAA
jgi:CheY-like chemotaxis protein